MKISVKSVASVAATLGLVAVVLCGLMLVWAASAGATPGLQTAFVAQYPDTRESSLNSCSTCHMPNVEDFLNGYGLALREAKIDFGKIEEEDSDGDGVINREEIANHKNPGSQATYPEYFVFHVNFSDEDPDLGKVHFNHEMHTIKESFLSKGRCSNCHGKDLFPKQFNDQVSVRVLAHQVCWRCHETSGSKLAPTDCTQCHTGIEGIVESLKGLLK